MSVQEQEQRDKTNIKPATGSTVRTQERSIGVAVAPVSSLTAPPLWMISFQLPWGFFFITTQQVSSLLPSSSCSPEQTTLLLRPCTLWCHSLDMNTVFQGHVNHFRVPQKTLLSVHDTTMMYLCLARVVDCNLFIYFWLMNLLLYCSVTGILTLISGVIFLLQGCFRVIVLLRFYWLIILARCSQVIVFQRI